MISKTPLAMWGCELKIRGFSGLRQQYHVNLSEVLTIDTASLWDMVSQPVA